MKIDNQLIKFDYNFWRQHPDWFIEEFYGIKLFQWQKLFLKRLLKNEFYYHFSPNCYYHNYNAYFSLVIKFLFEM